MTVWSIIMLGISKRKLCMMHSFPTFYNIVIPKEKKNTKKKSKNIYVNNYNSEPLI